MDGIVFFATGDLGPVVEFYADVVGAEVWLEQPDCTVLTHGGFRFGFCGRAETDDCATRPSSTTTARAWTRPTSGWATAHATRPR